MKIILKPGQDIFISSDTHYNHFNLVSSITKWETSRLGTTRDFKSLSHHNQTIVDNINAVIKPDDIFIHLGDWSFGSIESIWEFRKQINCKNIYLIFGNHDDHIIDNKPLPNCHLNDSIDDSENPPINDGPNPNQYRDGRDEYFNVYAQDLFVWCGHYAEFEIVYPQINKQLKTPKHKFVAMHYPIASHNGMGKGIPLLFGHLHSVPRKRVFNSRALDVGVDGNNYKPYHLSDALWLIKDNPIESLIIDDDHHVK